MWMMAALFTGLGILLGGGLFLANKVVRSVGISASTANSETIHTAGGDFRLQSENQVGPALPVYPRGALELPGANAAQSRVKDLQKGVSVVTYHASDSRDFVDNWYSQHLAPEFTRHDPGEKPVPEAFQNTPVSETDIAFAAERGALARIVALAMDGSGTRISLIRVDKTPPQQNP